MFETIDLEQALIIGGILFAAMVVVRLAGQITRDVVMTWLTAVPSSLLVSL